LRELTAVGSTRPRLTVLKDIHMTLRTQRSIRTDVEIVVPASERERDGGMQR
jgi:hypothetical protein